MKSHTSTQNNHAPASTNTVAATSSAQLMIHHFYLLPFRNIITILDAVIIFSVKYAHKPIAAHYRPLLPHVRSVNFAEVLSCLPRCLTILS